MPEIERKFRVTTPPPERYLQGGTPIKQAYLLSGETELRVRAMGDDYFMTVKSPGGLTRDEWETALPDWVFTSLWIEGARWAIEKTRYAIVDGTTTLEIDVYAGALEGLMILECEFRTAAAAAEFRLPPWAQDAVEVTTDPAYKNKNLALRGLPSGLA